MPGRERRNNKQLKQTSLSKRYQQQTKEHYVKRHEIVRGKTLRKHKLRQRRKQTMEISKDHA